MRKMRAFVCLSVILIALMMVTIALAAASSHPRSAGNLKSIHTTLQLAAPHAATPDHELASPLGDSGGWDNNSVCCASVLMDGGQYKLWYTGWDANNIAQLGLATSSDGINWTKSASNPLFPGSEAYILKVSSSDYRMWYSDSNNGDIRYATSYDGMSWALYPSAVFTPTHQAGDWDKDFVFDPSVLISGTTFLMYYEGGDNSANRVQIGLATSLDGIHWTRLQADPVLTYGDPGEWDEMWVLDPMVLPDGAGYQMWYRGRHYSGGQALGYATSPDGVNWTKYGGNPVFQGTPGTWDESGVSQAFVYDAGKSYQMWYFSASMIGYATSPDGVSWTPYGDPVLLPSPHVHIDVQYHHDWISVDTTPYASVAITVSDAGGGIKATFAGQADVNGFLEVGHEYPDIQTGDRVQAAVEDVIGEVNPVGEIVGLVDADHDTVSGNIFAPWFETVKVACVVWQMPGQPSVEVPSVPGDGGSYTCDFSGIYDLQPGLMMFVMYYEPDGDRVIGAYDVPWMVVDYGQDFAWVNYPHGHTFWITVTEDTGEVIATTQGQTVPDQGRGRGMDGFTTNSYSWVPSQPDIQPGNRVYFKSDDGFYDELRVGDIQGVLSVETDSVGGPIYAAWETQTLQVECQPWGAPGGAPFKNSTAEPDGSAPFFCQWDPLTEWDILPGQPVGVNYHAPDDYDLIQTVFKQPAPELNLNVWMPSGGQVAPDGPVIFNIDVGNNGDLIADTYRVTDTLPLNATYLADTSGAPVESGPGWVAWTLSGLEPGQWQSFQLVLLNQEQAGSTLTNTLDVYHPYDTYLDNNHAETSFKVVEGQPDLWVSKFPSPYDPTPGQTFRYHIQYGNNGPVGSGSAVLIETLPEHTSLVEWRSDDSSYNLWHQVSYSNEVLILETPSIPGWWNNNITLILRVDEDAPYDEVLVNTVEIYTDDDSDPSNNWFQNSDAKIGPPRWDAGIQKSFKWGILVPGGTFADNLYYYNNGNMAVQAVITETLPEGTSYVGAWSSMDDSPFPPTYVDDQIAVWEGISMEPGEQFVVNVQLNIDGDVSPGTVLTNCVEIGVDGPDNYTADNFSCYADTVRQPGVNLRLRKNYRWNGSNQLEYDLQIENIGTVPLSNVWMTDTYPLSTTWNGEWWVNSKMTWITVTHQADERQLIFWIQDLWPGSVNDVGYRIDLNGDVSGVGGLQYTNYAQAPWPEDVFPDDNYAQTTATGGVDVYIGMKVTGGELRAGELVTFTVFLGNGSAWDAQQVVITDTLPEGMTFVSATKPGDPATPWMPQILPGNRLVWDYGEMWRYENTSFDVVVRINDTLRGSQVLTNTIEAYPVGAGDVDLFPDNNSYVFSMTITGPTFLNCYLPLLNKP